MDARERGPFRPNRTIRIPNLLALSNFFQARNSEQLVIEFVARHASFM